METISTQFVRNVLKERPVDMHKGQAGRVLIVAGSRGMAGAAVLAARGALYSGAGLVKIGATDNIIDILQVTVPEAMCIDRQNMRDEDILKYNAIAIGPGIGVSEENYRLITRILEVAICPVILDADALTCISEYGMPENSCESIIMTPHMGEASRLVAGLGITELDESRECTAKAIAGVTGATVLLKGAGTIIAPSSGDKTFINSTGNPGMATGGSGDVLTGMITALMGAEYLDASVTEKVCAGAFIHGLAGDIAAENIGEYGMTSADIADAVSVAFREMLGKQ